MARVGVTIMESYIRGVTTLHHYKRVSSRDLGWHQRETEGEEVKQSCFLTNEWNHEPWEIERTKRDNTREMNEIANNPLEKRDEEHYDNLKVAKAWIKSLMDKIEFETTLVKTRWERKNPGNTPLEHGRNWTWTWQDERILDEINNILPPELLKKWHKG